MGFVGAIHATLILPLSLAIFLLYVFVQSLWNGYYMAVAVVLGGGGVLNSSVVFFQEQRAENA